MNKYLLLGLVLSAVYADDTIKIGVGAEPFFEWHQTDEEGQIEGYDIEVALEACTRIKQKCEIHAEPWKTIFSSLRFGKYDLVSSQVTINEDRSRVLHFSVPYGMETTPFLMRDGNEKLNSFCPNCGVLDLSGEGRKILSKEIDSIAGLSFAVYGFSVQGKLLRNLQEMHEISVIETDSYDEILNLVASGKVDIGVGPMKPRREAFNASTGSNIVEIFSAQGGELGAEIGLVFPKKSDLTERFNTALQEMQADGTLRKISIKWFGEDVSPK